MNIAYCINSIKGIGGIQRVTIIKANALAEVPGNKIYIIITDDQNTVQCGDLSPKVNFINLNINYYADDWKKGITNRISQWQKILNHRKKLKQALTDINPHVVVSVGQSEKFLSIKGLLRNSNPVYIREFHFASNYRLHFSNGIRSKLLAHLQNVIDFQFACRFLYDAVVCLTPQDVKENWSNRKNIYFLPNPLTISPTSTTETKINKIVAIGRLTAVKNFSSLINSFSLIAEKNPSWILDIIGEGEERANLQALIASHHLQNQVRLVGYTDNISVHLHDASICVSTSLTEGFPLVFFEAMVHRIPMISYNNYGAAFIIDEGKTGFLINMNDEVNLSSKIQLLIDNAAFRQEMGKQAFDKAQLFLPDKIANSWMELFRLLILKKNI